MSDFELLGGAEDETRLLRDRSTGYSLAIPGLPTVLLLCFAVVSLRQLCPWGYREP